MRSHHPPKKDIVLLARNGDLEKLVWALRDPDDAERRFASATALSNLGRFEATESLVRSSLEDPQEDVRQAAHAGLVQLLGVNPARDALNSYQAAEAPEDPWLRQEDFNNETRGRLVEDRQSRSEWAPSDISGLSHILVYGKDPALRSKAINALSQIDDMQAIEVLVFAAQGSDEQFIRQAARKALEERYGEDIDSIIKNYLQGEEEIDDEEFDNESTDQIEWGSQRAYKHRQLDYFVETPVMKEEKPGSVWLIGLLIILVIIALFLVMK
jgi:HEAT repeat protein